MELLKGLKLDIEVFGGEDIADIAQSICTLATRVGILVEADFNGVRLWALPNDDPAKLVKAYHIELKKPQAYTIAMARNI